MDRETPPDWYLDIEGTRSGPYTTEQVEGFLREGEILPRHRVIPAKHPDQSISVGDFIAALYRPSPSQPSTSTDHRDGFQAPPRPSDMDERTGILKAPVADASETLFDALQVAREGKMNAKMATPDLREWGKARAATSTIPPQALLVGTLIALLGVSIWGIARLASSPADSDKKDSSHPIATIQTTPADAAPTQPKNVVKAEPKPVAVPPSTIRARTAIPAHAPAPRVAVPSRLRTAEPLSIRRVTNPSATGGRPEANTDNHEVDWREADRLEEERRAAEEKREIDRRTGENPYDQAPIDDYSGNTDGFYPPGTAGDQPKPLDPDEIIPVD